MKEKTISAAELAAAIKGADEDARWDAVAKAPGADVDAIAPLAAIMAGADPAAAKAASEALRKVAHARGQAAPAELLKLTGPDYPRQVRADALRYLGETGGRGQVRELEALLSDSDVSEEARMALEQIPDSEAEKALERASESGPPACRAACRQSLRKRRRAMRDAGIRRRGRF